MKMRMCLATCVVALSLAPTAEAANVRLAEGCLFEQKALCAGGTIASVDGRVSIKVTSVESDGALKYSYNGKSFTARGVCASRAVIPVPSQGGICETTNRNNCSTSVAAAQARPTLTMEAKRFDVPDLAVRLPVTKEGQCYLVGVAKGMSMQGAIRMGSIYCPKVENGRAYFDVQRLEMALTDNAWAGILSAALNGVIGDVAGAAIHANAIKKGGGGGGSFAASAAQSTVNIVQSQSGSYGAAGWSGMK